jgi:hypothetical protein
MRRQPVNLVDRRAMPGLLASLLVWPERRRKLALAAHDGLFRLFFYHLCGDFGGDVAMQAQGNLELTPSCLMGCFERYSA